MIRSAGRGTARPKLRRDLWRSTLSVHMDAEEHVLEAGDAIYFDATDCTRTGAAAAGCAARSPQRRRADIWVYLVPIIGRPVCSRTSQISVRTILRADSVCCMSVFTSPWG
jgi:hypothetical protein